MVAFLPAQFGELPLQGLAAPRLGVAAPPRLLQRRLGRVLPAPQAAIEVAALERAQPGFGRFQRRRPGFGGPEPVPHRLVLPRMPFEAPRGIGKPAVERVALRLRRAQAVGGVAVGAAHAVRQHVHHAIGLRPQILGRGGMGHHRPERPGNVAPRHRARPERLERRLVPRRAGGADGGVPAPVEPLVQHPRQRGGLAAILHEPGVHLVIGGVGLRARSPPCARSSPDR